MDAIHSDLVNLRSGIENIVSNWDAAQFVVSKVEKMVTIDLTKKEELKQQAGSSKQRRESGMMGCRAVSVDQCLMTMVKLNDANKEALNPYGNLGALPLHDALYKAGSGVYHTDETCHIQLMQRAAELHHPDTNSLMGLNYQLGGWGREKSQLGTVSLRGGNFASKRSLGDGADGLLSSRE